MGKGREGVKRREEASPPRLWQAGLPESNKKVAWGGMVSKVCEGARMRGSEYATYSQGTWNLVGEEWARHKVAGAVCSVLGFKGHPWALGRSREQLSQ